MSLKIKYFLQKKKSYESEQRMQSQVFQDLAITQSAKKEKKDLNMAFVYLYRRQAFDNLPHTWIMEVLEMHNVCPTVRTFINKQTQMCLCCDRELLMKQSIAVRRSIFQASESTTSWICHRVAPADLTLFAKDEYQMKQTLVIVKNFSTDRCHLD